MSNWNQHFDAIHTQFISNKVLDEQHKKYQAVFKAVFTEVKRRMAAKCTYFRKYAKDVLYPSNLNDSTKISKLNEFCAEIVINLPISYEKDIIIEVLGPEQPGFVNLRIEKAFDLLLKPNENNELKDECHNVISEWRDTRKYFLPKKFRDWMDGVLKELVEENSVVSVKESTYDLEYEINAETDSFQLIIRNADDKLELKVDVLPALRLQCSKCWPKNYREEKNRTIQDWLILPKEFGKDSPNNRRWRVCFRQFERHLLKGYQHLKPTIRLMKKLRDSRKMTEIRGYYIETFFLWKITELNRQKSYWQTGIGVLFRAIVKEFYETLEYKQIKYFWQEDSNLIAHVNDKVLDEYVRKLKKFVHGIDVNDVNTVLTYMVDINEMKHYKNSDAYKRDMSQARPMAPIANTSKPSTPQVCHQEPIAGTSKQPSKAQDPEPIANTSRLSSSQTHNSKPMANTSKPSTLQTRHLEPNPGISKPSTSTMRQLEPVARISKPSTSQLHHLTPIANTSKPAMPYTRQLEPVDSLSKRLYQHENSQIMTDGTDSLYENNFASSVTIKSSVTAFIRNNIEDQINKYTKPISRAEVNRNTGYAHAVLYNIVQLLLSLRGSIDKLAQKDGDDDEIKKQIGIIKLLADKTDEQGKLLQELKTSDQTSVQYADKLSEVSIAVALLISENDAMKMDVGKTCKREADHSETLQETEDQDGTTETEGTFTSSLKTLAREVFTGPSLFQFPFLKKK